MYWYILCTVHINSTTLPQQGQARLWHVPVPNLHTAYYYLSSIQPRPTQDGDSNRDVREKKREIHISRETDVLGDGNTASSTGHVYHKCAQPKCRNLGIGEHSYIPQLFYDET